MFNYKDHAVKQRQLKSITEEYDNQIKRLTDINNERKEKFKKEVEKLNGKPGSSFYGLRHQSKFQILDKYISDKYHVCPDITDQIWKCLKKKLINDNQDRFYKTELLRTRRETYLNPHTRYLGDYQPTVARLFKVNDYIDLGNIQLHIFDRRGLKDAFRHGLHALKIHTNKNDFDKNKLMDMCDKSGIKYKKSWNKQRLFNLLLE